MYIQRIVQSAIAHILERGKSVLLLGPRQTGKTTLIKHIVSDRYITLANPYERIRYEKEPYLLTGEIEALQASKQNAQPLVIIDEIQKVPLLLDAVQDLIDRKIAKFILTGSSARKLQHKVTMNWLPGRVIPLRLDPFMQTEYVPYQNDLNTILLDGTLPEVALNDNMDDRETLLEAYVTIYLEEEIRAEALVRDLGPFARFIELAASESGKIVNMQKLSNEIGVSHSTITGYFQILEDCLVAERIEPIISSKTRRKLSKTQKYVFYDLGVRRLAAKEGRKPPREYMGHLFEQYVGLELIRQTRSQHRVSIKYWRDASGPEVDWVVDTQEYLIPIEVKWTDTPKLNDAKFLHLFLKEHDNAPKGYIVCRTKHPVKISDEVLAIPWEGIADILNEWTV